MELPELVRRSRERTPVYRPAPGCARGPRLAAARPDCGDRRGAAWI